MSANGPSLSERLQAFHRAMVHRMSPSDVEALRRGEEEAASSGVAATALQGGDRAPDFRLPDQHGRPVHLAERLALGPVVLVFSRGGWCPFCALALRAWQDALSDLHDAGGDLLAISPQPARACSQTAERDLLAYPVLSDAGNLVADQYGVAHDQPEVLRPVYKRLGHDLPRINGTGDWRSPLAATFVVAPDGRIALAHVELVTWRQLEPEAAVRAVRELTR